MDDRLLFRCEDPACGAYRRTRRPDPYCHGTETCPHDPAHMRVVEDLGQESTPGVVLGGPWAVVS